jgi:uncharacterized protein
MRREDKAVKDPLMIQGIFSRARVVHLGFCDGDKPYVVPLCFGVSPESSDNCFYIHCAREGRKWDLLKELEKKGGALFFTLHCDESTRDGGDEGCAWSMKYRCIMGTANPVFIEEDEERQKALGYIMKKYSGRDNFRYSTTALEATGLVRLDILTLTGKQTGYPAETN